MKYRTFGRTGIEVSELIFGCGNTGGLLIRKDPDTMRAAVRRALDGGINWFDTAAQYGQGKSEESLGWLLAEIDEKPYVSTKVRIDPARSGDIPGQIEAAVHQSLERLNRDSVDLLQFHNRIEPEAGEREVGEADVLRAGGVADALAVMRDQGLTRFIGMTALGDAGACRRVLDSGRFDAAQVYYNILNPSAGQSMPPGWNGHDFTGIIDTCRAHGIAVIDIRVFAAGIIAAGAAHGREAILTKNTERDDEVRMTRAAFAVLGTDYGTQAQVAIRFALANPDIASVNVGFGELDHIDEDLEAIEMGPLPEEAIDRLGALYPTDFGRL